MTGAVVKLGEVRWSVCRVERSGGVSALWRGQVECVPCGEVRWSVCRVERSGGVCAVWRGQVECVPCGEVRMFFL